MQLKLKNLMSKLNNKWYLPTLQRDYVWLEKAKEKKIEKFFDSLMLGYPIGQIVIWKNQNKEEIQNMKVYKFLESYEINGDNKTVSLLFDKSKIDALVLDGQQRLTSLFITTRHNGFITDGSKTKYLYLDLLYNPDKSAVDEVTYKFEFKSEDEVQDADAETLWFKVADLVDSNDSTFDKYKKKIPALLEKLSKEQQNEKMKEIERTLHLLWKNVREKKINCEVVKKDDIDCLLEIFVRLNDGGVKLEKADLLLSFMESDSKLFQPKGAREIISSFVQEINNRHAFKEKVKTNKDFILKASLMLSGLSIKYKITNFTKENLIKIDSCWKKIQKTTTFVYQLLDKYHFTEKTLTSNNALLPIAYYLQKIELNKQSFITSEIDSIKETRNMLINWLSQVLISGTFSGSSDTILTKYRNKINDNCSKLEVIESKKLTQKDIENLVEKSVYQGKNTQLILFLVTDSKYWENSQDHIFPQENFKNVFLNKHKDLMNSIGNLQLLSKPVNSQKNNMSALDWANQLNEDTKKGHLYPDDIKLTNENFEQFVNARKKLIIKKLCERFEAEYKEDSTTN